MQNLLKKQQKGFTIIEIMVVLAIAGLILAIVFLAIPQVQRNSRDNARQSVGARIKSEIETYGANNSGTFPFSTDTGVDGTQNCSSKDSAPGCWKDFYDHYISGKVNDSANGVPLFNPAAGGPAAYKPIQCGSGRKVGGPCSGYTRSTFDNLGIGNADVIYGAKCSGDNTSPVVAALAGTASKFTGSYTLVVKLDRGNPYCIGNG